jgi:phage FluMu protein Com
MIQLKCTHCGKDKITAPDSMAGKNARCPACKKILQIPAPEEETVTALEVVDEDDEEVKPAKRVTRRPARDAVTAKAGVRRGQAADEDEEDDIPEVEAAEDDDEEEERRPRKKKRKRRRGPRGSYADCPQCGSPGQATKVIYTWWGGFLGPLIFSLVQCEHCGAQYNGTSGSDSSTGIMVWKVLSVISIFIALALITLSLIGTRMVN